MIAYGTASRDTALRAELAAAIANQSGPARPSLLAHVLAAGFADRLLSALESGRFLELVGWVDQSCERYAAQPAILAMLSAGCAIARPVLRKHDAFPSVDDLATLEHAIARAVARHERNEADASDSVLDETDVAIATFLARLDEADVASAEHSRAVSLWCRRIARRLALDDDEVIHVTRSGLLHDVGKTMTPRDILQAPRGLTDAEWVVMREHTQLGGAMVREVPLLRPFIPAVRSHHERLDGKGYPDRLAASEISLVVRIVTVADSFNAMIGHRPYRLPMSPSRALEQLVAHRGTQFDPMIVEAMIDVVERAD